MSWGKCPSCGGENVGCIDSRHIRKSTIRTWRRYKCFSKKCGKRFTTVEEIVHQGIPPRKKTPVISLLEASRRALEARIQRVLDKPMSRRERSGTQPRVTSGKRYK